MLNFKTTNTTTTTSNQQRNNADRKHHCQLHKHHRQPPLAPPSRRLGPPRIELTTIIIIIIILTIILIILTRSSHHGHPLFPTPPPTSILGHHRAATIKEASGMKPYRNSPASATLKTTWPSVFSFFHLQPSLQHQPTRRSQWRQLTNLPTSCPKENIGTPPPWRCSATAASLSSHGKHNWNPLRHKLQLSQRVTFLGTAPPPLFLSPSRNAHNRPHGSHVSPSCARCLAPCSPCLFLAVHRPGPAAASEKHQLSRPRPAAAREAPAAASETATAEQE